MLLLLQLMKNHLLLSIFDDYAAFSDLFLVVLLFVKFLLSLHLVLLHLHQ